MGLLVVKIKACLSALDFFADSPQYKNTTISNFILAMLLEID